MKLDKVCRMCSSEKLRVRPIFKAYKRERLLDIIRDVVRIEVREGDGLPWNICKPCATTLIRIQENLEEFRGHDRELRGRILGGGGEKLDVKVEEHDGQDSVETEERLDPVEDDHQTATNEDPNENRSVLSKIEIVVDPISDAHNDRIEHISMEDDVVTKEDVDDSFESEHQLDYGEDSLNFDDDSHENISDLVATNDNALGKTELQFNEMDMLLAQNDDNVQIELISIEESVVTKDELDENNPSSVAYEPDRTTSDQVLTESVSKEEVYAEVDANVESQNPPDSEEDRQTDSDYEPEGSKSKPKLKPIRASQRQRAVRARELAAGKKKRGRPPKYDDGGGDDPDRPKMNDHKCYICRSESLGSAKALLEHLTTHLDRTPYTCPDCKMETVVVKSVRTLNYHMKMHAQPMKCEYCDRRYCDDRARDYHFKTYHLGESAPCPSTCDTCGKVCKSISALKTHMRDHRLSLRCEHCDKIFHRRSKLKDHIARVHEKAQKYECSLCKRVVHSLDSYNSHLKMHTSEKTYECDICPMKFYTAGNLGLHKKIHSSNANYKPHKDWSGHYTVSQEPGSDKLYTCKLCGKSYTKTVMKINNHLKSHFKEIKCDRCDLMFVNESQLKVHYVVHTGIRQHKCDHCGKDFLHKNNLTQHLKIHRTERDFACEFCGKLFTYKEGMKAHIRNHHLRDSPYKCARCRRKFVDNASLERHIAAEHEPPPVQVDLGPPPLMGTISVPQVPNFEAIGKD